jgi:SpoVK/Ycf46/Vps4 family AAA+-type ATPase
MGQSRLPAEVIKSIKLLARRIRLGRESGKSSARGDTVLLSGASGSLSKMAADVLAVELGQSMHQVDMSTVVSKYIGETEKNLRKLFDVAEEGGVILLFDEADALFGKRSEIEDAHDRFANVDTGYLLQAIENHPGVVLLACNKKGNIDPAFIRRIRYVVEFPKPE